MTQQVKDVDGDVSSGLGQRIVNSGGVSEGIGIVIEQVELLRWMIFWRYTLTEGLRDVGDDDFQGANIEGTLAIVEPVVDMGAQVMGAAGDVFAFIGPAVNVVGGLTDR